MKRNMFAPLWMCLSLLLLVSPSFARPSWSTGILDSKDVKLSLRKPVQFPNQFLEAQDAVKTFIEGAKEEAIEHLAAMKQKHMQLARQQFANAFEKRLFRLDVLKPRPTWQLRPCIGNALNCFFLPKKFYLRRPVYSKPYPLSYMNDQNFCNHLPFNTYLYHECKRRTQLFYTQATTMPMTEAYSNTAPAHATDRQTSKKFQHATLPKNIYNLDTTPSIDFERTQKLSSQKKTIQLENEILGIKDIENEHTFINPYSSSPQTETSTVTTRKFTGSVTQDEFANARNEPETSTVPVNKYKPTHNTVIVDHILTTPASDFEMTVEGRFGQLVTVPSTRTSSITEANEFIKASHGHIINTISPVSSTSDLTLTSSMSNGKVQEADITTESTGNLNELNTEARENVKMSFPPEPDLTLTSSMSNGKVHEAEITTESTGNLNELNTEAREEINLTFPPESDLILTSSMSNGKVQEAEITTESTGTLNELNTEAREEVNLTFPPESDLTLTSSMSNGKVQEDEIPTESSGTLKELNNEAREEVNLTFPPESDLILTSSMSNGKVQEAEITTESSGNLNELNNEAREDVNLTFPTESDLTQTSSMSNGKVQEDNIPTELTGNLKELNNEAREEVNTSFPPESDVALTSSMSNGKVQEDEIQTESTVNLKELNTEAREEVNMVILESTRQYDLTNPATDQKENIDITDASLTDIPPLAREDIQDFKPFPAGFNFQNVITDSLLIQTTQDSSITSSTSLNNWLNEVDSTHSTTDSSKSNQNQNPALVKSTGTTLYTTEEESTVQSRSEQSKDIYNLQPTQEIGSTIAESTLKPESAYTTFKTGETVPSKDTIENRESAQNLEDATVQSTSFKENNQLLIVKTTPFYSKDGDTITTNGLVDKEPYLDVQEKLLDIPLYPSKSDHLNSDEDQSYTESLTSKENIVEPSTSFDYVTLVTSPRLIFEETTIDSELNVDDKESKTLDDIIVTTKYSELGSNDFSDKSLDTNAPTENASSKSSVISLPAHNSNTKKTITLEENDQLNNVKTTPFYNKDDIVTTDNLVDNEPYLDVQDKLLDRPLYPSQSDSLTLGETHSYTEPVKSVTEPSTEFEHITSVTIPHLIFEETTIDSALNVDDKESKTFDEIIVTTEYFESGKNDFAEKSLNINVKNENASSESSVISFPTNNSSSSKHHIAPDDVLKFTSEISSTNLDKTISEEESSSTPVDTTVSEDSFTLATENEISLRERRSPGEELSGKIEDTSLNKENSSAAYISPTKYAATILELLPVIKEGFKNNAFSDEDKKVIRSIFGEMRTFMDEDSLKEIEDSATDLLMGDETSRVEDMGEYYDYESSESEEEAAEKTERRLKRSKTIHTLTTLVGNLPKHLQRQFKDLSSSSLQRQSRKTRSSGPQPVSEAAAILALLAEDGEGVQLDRADDEDDDEYEYYEDDDADEDEDEDSSYEDSYEVEDNPSFTELIKLARKHRQRKAME